MSERHILVGQALRELVEQASTGGPLVRVGLMAVGSEHGATELLEGARLAMTQDAGLRVVAIGPRPEGADDLEWIETDPCESAAAEAMEKAQQTGTIAGAVALHYPFPLGVATIGRVLTPARGRPMLVASCTGATAIARPEAMVRNAVYGIAVAKTLGIAEPTLGIANLESAATVHRALTRLRDGGYPITFGTSIRADGGPLLRGNDLLTGAVDVCVCDTLTGNLLMKLFAAFNTGGGYEASGWGYGPSVGEDWHQLVSIISRASGAPVVGNALLYTAAVIRGGLRDKVRAEIAQARRGGLDGIIESLSAPPAGAETVTAPPKEPTDAEIHGVDVLSLDAAVRDLWKEGIWAEAAMGCTGPVVKLNSRNKERAREILCGAGLI